MLRSSLLLASRSSTIRRIVENNRMTQRLVGRFVAGEGLTDALHTAHSLTANGLTVSLDHLGERVSTRVQVNGTVEAYQHLLRALTETGLAGSVEISVKLSALGQFLGADGERIALECARSICREANAAGTTVTVDMEDHTTVDSTLTILRELHTEFPWVGAVLQSYLRRTESDCAQLAAAGSRVRLCKGAYQEPATVAFPQTADVDLSYVRCLRILMASKAYPMVATHDPRLIAIAEEIARDCGRQTDEYEFQMLHGVRPEEHLRLASDGKTLRVYVPYGREWYPYFMRRLAERPANIGFFLRSLASRD